MLGVILELYCFIKFPYKQKSISNVFVRRAAILVNLRMDHLRDLIHKSHDSNFQHFRGVSEVSNITEPENCESLGSWDHRVDISSLVHIVCDNFRACFTES